MLQKWTTATTVMIFLLLYLTAQEWMKWHCFKVKNFKIQHNNSNKINCEKIRYRKIHRRNFLCFFFVKKCDVVFAKKCFVCFFSFLQIAKKNANEVKKNRFATKWEYFFNYFLLLLCLEKNCPAYHPNEWASRKVDWNTRCEFGKHENFMAVFTRIYANIPI